MRWKLVLPGVWRFADSCNVYAIQGPTGCVVVDAGTGAWLDASDELPSPVVALCCTHYFRDHSGGAALATDRGIPVYVPAYEADIFADPQEHFRSRQTYIIYDNLWNLFAPIDGIPIAGVLQDYAQVQLAGLDIEILPLPGATLTQVGLRFAINGQCVICCGETIHSPGKVPRVAPYQYNYNDLHGAVQTWRSLGFLNRFAPNALLPSLGEPIVDEVEQAIDLTRQNLRDLIAARPGLEQSLAQLELPPLKKVTDHIWLDTQSVSNNWYVISESGKALVIDYGYSRGDTFWPSYPHPEHRRPLLHGLDALKSQFGIDRIDVALISHFHDDHVCGIPTLQRLFATQAWATSDFAHLLNEPQAHCFPCDWPHKVEVTRTIPGDGRVQWEEYEFHFAPMNGHTRFASLIGFEADGKRIAHTGDQYFFVGDLKDWQKNRRLQNHVYRNGAMLDGYDLSGKWMLDFRPDIVLQGHMDPYFTDEHFFEHIRAWVHDYRELHEKVMPLGDQEVHFNLDSWGGWVWPYRTHMREAGEAKVTVTVHNPMPGNATLELRLVTPRMQPAWRGSVATVKAAGRAEESCEMRFTVMGPCRRVAIAVEMTIDGRPFGQVAEAMVTVGGDRF